MTFSSSRTLPGQSYWSSIRIAAVDTPSMDFPARRACVLRK